ncbi:MAG TPA: bifunctional diaminohydroxyphosphoribosylaminopyrimidine deaminase/5-amino-6-(5-phosphoribosylamino)uracil reductase RibD [Bacteroidia bacterium]|nr:bifunctional diaminohydroxyphosphoribosylaminopyrimidine deaminase/5-amino-6-(5-phosphoribosylamino)uracil reductase RibD [Bacteroidia bacterium]
MNHELYMRRCLELAVSASGKVAPNPLVGSVLVHNDMIVSEGFHEYFGGPHAEVNTLSKITDAEVLKNSILYVNLEPCCHYGKTPPCSSLIISKQIPSVVVANKDPNPKVNGGGIQLLQKEGINVLQGVLEKEGWNVNRRFFTFHTKKRPYVLLKWAQSNDGFIAPSQSKGITWISNASSRLLVHKWRSEEQSILIGSTTAINDNPKLNVRGFTGNDPLRIILDPDLKMTDDLYVLNEKVPTFIFNFVKDEIKNNLTYVKLKPGKKIIPDLLTELYSRDIQSVMVEGGTFTLNSFIESDCWDEIRVFTGPTDLKEGLKAPLLNVEPAASQMINSDTLTIFRNKNNS